LARVLAPENIVDLTETFIGWAHPSRRNLGRDVIPYKDCLCGK